MFRATSEAGVVGEFKELQINIFYDRLSTNYVPPWQPLVAGLGLHRGRELRSCERGDLSSGAMGRARGLNFHLWNPGPARWLWLKVTGGQQFLARSTFSTPCVSFHREWLVA